MSLVGKMEKELRCLLQLFWKLYSSLKLQAQGWSPWAGLTGACMHLHTVKSPRRVLDEEFFLLLFWKPLSKAESSTHHETDKGNTVLFLQWQIVQHEERNIIGK